MWIKSLYAARENPKKIQKNVINRIGRTRSILDR
jgi:hypothetical protein